MGRSRGQIIFRHLGEVVGPGCEPGRNWQVEFHEGRGFPSGLAWVLVPPAPRRGPKAAAPRPVIKFLLVDDGCRRRGIATALVEACRGRWPGAALSLPVSAAGVALCEKLEPSSPEAVFAPEFIARCTRAGVGRDELTAAARDHLKAGVPTAPAGERPRPKGEQRSRRKR